MAINSNVVSHFFHFRPDEDWNIQSKCRQSYFSELKLVTDNLLSINDLSLVQHEIDWAVGQVFKALKSSRIQICFSHS